MKSHPTAPQMLRPMLPSLSCVKQVLLGNSPSRSSRIPLMDQPTPAGALLLHLTNPTKSHSDRPRIRQARQLQLIRQGHLRNKHRTGTLLLFRKDRPVLLTLLLRRLKP